MERGRNEVRVMTVHGAKGLEADIVILPDTTSLPGGLNRGEGHLLYTADAVLFPLPKQDAPQATRAAKARRRRGMAARAPPPFLCGADARARPALHLRL